MAQIEFTVIGNPIPKARPRLGKRNQTYTPQRTKNWEAEVGWACKRDNPGVSPLQGDVSVWMEFYRSTRHKCDLDNLVKGVNDGLNGIAFEDDTQVIEIHAWLKYDKEHPRVEVKVQSI